MPKRNGAKLRKIIACIKTPFLNIEGQWEADENEQNAAWELYVELITRISVVKLNPNEGLLREALSSLNLIFKETRQVLKKYGPGIAKPKGSGTLSLGHIAVTVINSLIRPILSKWHPLLMDYENTKRKNLSPFEHEKRWGHNKELRKVLNDLQIAIQKYADLLAEVAGIQPLNKK